MRKINARLLIVLLMMVFIFNILTSAYSLVEDVRVLMISSYSPSFMTFFHQIEGIKSVLDNPEITLDIEFMDSKRFFTEENLDNFYQSISYKLKDVQYDVLIVSDDNALNFALEYQDILFKNLPIVFLGINNLDNAYKAASQDLITGVVEASSIDKTIEIGIDLNPKAKNIVALTDPTTSGQGDLRRYMDLESQFPDYNFEIIDLSALSYDEFKTELRQLNNEDVVVLLSVYSDKNNQRVDFFEGLEMVVTNCNQPVYHPYMHGIGQGLIGGKVISHFEQGHSAGKLVLQILEGVPVGDIEYVNESPNQYVFDYEVMETYDISKSKLPKESLLLNYEEPFFIKYKEYVLVACMIILIQGIVILFLLKNIREKKIYQRELKRNHQILEESHKEVNQLNETLELKVKERTEMLEQSNEELNVALENLKVTQDRLILNQAMESYLELSRRLAHLINTPLGSALTSASYQSDILEKTSKLITEEQEVFEKSCQKLKESNVMMMSYIQRAIKVVNELQTFTIFEPIRQINLSESIRHYFELLSINPKFSRLEVKLLMDESLYIVTHEQMLHRVLKALVENALDYVEGDQVPLEVRLTRDDKHYIISVIDNGNGVKEEEQEDIFKPFFTSSAHKLGMGLFLAESSVYQTLKGKLVLDKNYRQGAKFDIILNKNIHEDEKVT